ncbi:MAG: hypothetical protein U0R52_11610 [Solirubrobacterales bacterium]
MDGSAPGDGAGRADPHGQSPLLPGRIHGVRIWYLRSERGSLRIAGLNGVCWEAGGSPTRAHCAAYGERQRTAREHRPPDPHCTCGLYAMHPWAGQAGEVADSLAAGGRRDAIGVLGIVEAWGRVEVHADGFRAELARPRAFVHLATAFDDSHRELLEGLARVHGAELIRVPDAAALVEVCAARFPGIDPGTVEELLSVGEYGGEEASPAPGPAGWGPSGTLGPGGPGTGGPGGLGTGRPGAPAGGATRRARLLAIAGEAARWVGLGIYGLVVVLWYSMWIGVGVAFFGGLFLGWFDEPAKPPPQPVQALRVVEQRLVRNDSGDVAYLALVRNTSRTRAAVGVYPFGELRDRQGHRRAGLDPPRRVEIRPTVAPGATAVVLDELGRPLPRGLRPQVRFAAGAVRPAHRTPFEVTGAEVNRRLCVVMARLRAARPLRSSQVAVVGRDGEGRLLGAAEAVVGPVPRGGSPQVLGRLDPADCHTVTSHVEAYPAPAASQVLRRRK